MNSFTGVFQRFCCIDTEKLSKMQISSQVFFKDFADRFGITYLKKWISLKLFFENFVDRFQNTYQFENQFEYLPIWGLKIFRRGAVGPKKGGLFEKGK